MYVCLCSIYLKNGLNDFDGISYTPYFAPKIGYRVVPSSGEPSLTFFRAGLTNGCCYRKQKSYLLSLKHDDGKYNHDPSCCRLNLNYW